MAIFVVWYRLDNTDWSSCSRVCLAFPTQRNEEDIESFSDETAQQIGYFDPCSVGLPPVKEEEGAETDYTINSLILPQFDEISWWDMDVKDFPFVFLDGQKKSALSRGEEVSLYLGNEEDGEILIARLREKMAEGLSVVGFVPREVGDPSGISGWKKWLSPHKEENPPRLPGLVSVDLRAILLQQSRNSKGSMNHV